MNLDYEIYDLERSCFLELQSAFKNESDLIFQT